MSQGTLLLLGAGRRPLIDIPDMDVIRLDADPLLEPDIVCTLGEEHIPLPEDSVDVAVAVHVLEHIGQQGDTAMWFDFWEDLYRVLKADGMVQFESPRAESVWAWADPGHTRALSAESFIFLAQASYRIPDSAISPYRISCDFEPVGFWGAGEHNFRGQLRAVKPLVPWWLDNAAVGATEVAV
jgi:SAM-dependent methyltransferase